MKKLTVLLFAAILVFACNQPAGSKDAAGSFNLDSAKAAIEVNNKAFSAAIEKGDSAAVVASYTSDGCVMPDGGGPRMCGADLAKFAGMTKQMGVHSIKLTVTEVIGGKDLVSEEGNYEVADNGGKTLDKGRYLVTWKEEKGVWKKYRDMWNTDMPPGQQTPLK
jgi:ketosteroid isomerase-like protein